VHFYFFPFFWECLFGGEDFKTIKRSKLFGGMYINKQKSKRLGTTCPLSSATSTMEGSILFY